MKPGTWVKPNGMKVPVNESSAAYARSLGWKPLDGADAEQPEESMKEDQKPAHRGPGRPPKEKAE